MKKVYDIYQDAGHGWVKVAIKELERLGIAEHISHYSYYRKGWAYIEEDGDLKLFMDAKRARNEPVRFNEHHCNYSRIRNYFSYLYNGVKM